MAGGKTAVSVTAYNSIFLLSTLEHKRMLYNLVNWFTVDTAYMVAILCGETGDTYSYLLIFVIFQGHILPSNNIIWYLHHIFISILYLLLGRVIYFSRYPGMDNTD